MGDFASLGAKHRLHGGTVTALRLLLTLLHVCEANASFSFLQVQHHPPICRKYFFRSPITKKVVDFDRQSTAFFLCKVFFLK